MTQPFNQPYKANFSNHEPTFHDPTLSLSMDCTQEYLLDCLVYNPDTGQIRWKEDRPLDHFKSEHGRRIWRTKYAGRIAGYEDGGGYMRVRVGGRKMKMHRVVMIMVYGSIPDGMNPDHINGDGCDNRISNLRFATHSQNMRNKRATYNSTSGIVGVSWSVQQQQWKATISPDGFDIHLGFFDKKEDAANARKDAELKHFDDYSFTRSRTPIPCISSQ